MSGPGYLEVVCARDVGSCLGQATWKLSVREMLVHVWARLLGSLLTF